MRIYALLSAVFLVAMPAAGHHSDAGMDVDSIVAFEGSVTEFAFRNPHAYVLVETTANGERVEWTLQMGGVNGLTRRGWSADTLTLGDQVAVRVHPAEDGRPYGLVEAIEKEGGLGLTPTAGAPDGPADAAATSLTGKWRADRSQLVSYPGGFDGFFHALLKLTEQGAAAQAAYDPLSTENPESTCIGRPTPAAFVSSAGYLQEFELDEASEILFIRSEYFDEERTVYMDGRAHPGADERFATGHSIGWWEGRHARHRHGEFHGSSLPVPDRRPLRTAEARRRAVPADRERHAHGSGVHARRPRVHRRAAYTQQGTDLLAARGNVPPQLRPGIGGPFRSLEESIPCFEASTVSHPRGDVCPAQTAARIA